MVKVNFLGPIGVEAKELNIKNLSELREILKQDERLSKWLENSAVAINDKIVKSIDLELKDGDIISILPPVCGG